MSGLDIYLFTDGDMWEFEGAIHVGRKVLHVVGRTTAEPRFAPGRLFVTQGALGKLGTDGVIAAFDQHLAANWWGDDGDLDTENDIAIHNGDGAIYNVHPERYMCITYIGHETTLLLSEEY